ncbi:MAG: hypothetical protein K9I29_05010 [Bacteroidales bacterium]|nr:hypothetical protein [Bacteroidales bacterium]MCF8327633.1 hypothetical protein [Bacteroidales bacterium]
MKDMDYLQIVMRGFFNNRNYLERYFNREAQKAKKEYYEPDEFFNGCLDVIERFKNHLKEQIRERKKELNILIDLASEEQKIKQCADELHQLSEYDFTVNLFSLTKGQFVGNMFYEEVLEIEEAIQAGHTNEVQNLKALPPQPIVKQKPELNEKPITLKNNETIEKIHSELKGYFPNKEAELLKALQGE